MKSLFKEKKKLYEEWSRLKRLGENEDLSFEQFYKIRILEQEYYNKWKFLEGFTKAKEKVENEKKKKI